MLAFSRHNSARKLQPSLGKKFKKKERKKVLLVVVVVEVVVAAAAAAVVVVVVVDVVVVVVVMMIVMMIMIIIVVVVIMKKMMMGAALCFYHKICDSWTAVIHILDSCVCGHISTAPSTVHHRFTPLKTWSAPFTSSVQWQTVQLPHCVRGMGRRSERLQMYRDIDFYDTNAIPRAFCIRRASDIPTMPLTLPVQEQGQQSMTGRSYGYCVTRLLCYSWLYNQPLSI